MPHISGPRPACEGRGNWFQDKISIHQPQPHARHLAAWSARSMVDGETVTGALWMEMPRKSMGGMSRAPAAAIVPMAGS
ncbi:MAG: hypothetical protein V4733_08965 [Verrucomicrobiota bacterium]